ncbi:MAG: HAMP domain-containing sensor histidine kinase, partial [Ilumatobacteraceae bacterium]
IGIPAIDQGELFTRFHRASNAMTNFVPGTGLGLAIVKQIVDDHGGQIHLDSVEGKGTTVVIDLPVSPQDSFSPGKSMKCPSQ